ncbi:MULTISPECIES: GAF domain-containing protein [unclassified Nocardia]|uniref:GAF domain-containing protein n=1 Tax=unclassified Nocardia TaxID=2637762 RepID=UPI001CE3E085|nr:MULTISPECIES: GAF domain-containing protein [unclassified Nocardia]
MSIHNHRPVRQPSTLPGLSTLRTPSSLPSGHPIHCDKVHSGPCWNWVVVQTLTGPEQQSLVLDGPEPRSFSSLNHSSIGRNGVASRLLIPVVRHCAGSGEAQDKRFTLPDRRVMRMIAVPVPGPSNHVHAVAVWAGGCDDPVPPVPIVGAIEWDAAGVASFSPAAQFLLQTPDDLLAGCTVPEMLSRFTHWNARGKFLTMFNLEAPTDRWTGTATRHFRNGTRNQFYIAARASGGGANRIVRAVICDITGTQPTASPDPCSIAVRHMPVPPGHALALVDLKTGFVHEWLTEDGSPLAGWRHHNPEFDAADQTLVNTISFELATGVRQTAEVRVRVRFNPRDDWILVRVRCSRIDNGEQPQALIDITPIVPKPVPMVSNCQMCQVLARRAAERGEVCQTR